MWLSRGNLMGASPTPVWTVTTGSQPGLQHHTTPTDNCWQQHSHSHRNTRFTKSSQLLLIPKKVCGVAEESVAPRPLLLPASVLHWWARRAAAWQLNKERPKLAGGGPFTHWIALVYLGPSGKSGHCSEWEPVSSDGIIRRVGVAGSLKFSAGYCRDKPLLPAVAVT